MGPTLGGPVRLAKKPADDARDPGPVVARLDVHEPRLDEQRLHGFALSDADLEVERAAGPQHPALDDLSHERADRAEPVGPTVEGVPRLEHRDLRLQPIEIRRGYIRK